MKKIVRISLAIIVTFTLLIGVFQLAPDSWIDVGWNSRVSVPADQSQQVGLCSLCSLKLDSGIIRPQVGWNS